MKHSFSPITTAMAMLVGLLICAPLHAQRTCGTPAYIEQLSKKHPELREKRRMVEQRAVEGSQQFKMAANSVVTIPVVVHIVFNNAQENLPDEQIYNQIAVLNEDFRLLNVDAGNTPAPFQPSVADVQIQFCLASADPLGNPTSGITRTATAHGAFQYPTNDMKYTALGGIDAWDTERYLNIWVCDIDALGYAPYPGTAPAAEDGVVVDFAAMGKGGVAASPFDLGRTATHEVGHWLNLVHIWGDAECGDDQVADTPVAEEANGGCPAFPRVTSCGNDPNGEMFMNYMDYVDDRCMFMFSAGQKSRMLATFMPGGGRDGLLTSGGCGGACPRAQFLTDEFVAATETFQASDMVMGWNKITAGSDIQYHAGNSVVLRPGFHAQSGNVFRAWINGCTGPKNSGRWDTSTLRDATQVNMSNPSIYPNPADQWVRLQYQLTTEGDVSLTIFNALGAAVATPLQGQRQAEGQQNLDIPIGHLPQGIYRCVIRYPDGRSAQKPFVVAH